VTAGTEDGLIALDVLVLECDVVAVGVDAADVELGQTLAERVEQCTSQLQSWINSLDVRNVETEASFRKFVEVRLELCDVASAGFQDVHVLERDELAERREPCRLVECVGMHDDCGKT
jgi:hypothetical protein